jgi:RNA polymerase sigma-70 factor, ECF subfamily
MSIEQRNRVVKQALALRPMLVAYAFGLLRDYARAEDSVHEAYLIVMDKYEDFEEGTSMIAWCRTIVRFKIMETIRREQKLVPLEERILNDAVESAFQLVQRDSDVHRYTSLNEALDHCVARLAEGHRAMLTARYTEQLNYEELAKRFTINVETVRKRLYRIRQALRECVAEKESALGGES